MTRAFKAASLISLAMLALWAPPVVAQDLFTVEGETAVVTGHSTETSISRYTGPELSIDCGQMSLSGTLKSGANELTVMPTYTGASEGPSECDFGGSSFPLDLNGCSYDFTGETIQQDGGKADAVARITCPKNAEITTTSGLCAIKIPPQTPTAGGVAYTNEAGGKIRVAETLTGLTFTAEGAFCALFGLPSEGNTLDFVGAFVLEGFKDLGGPFNGDEFKEGAHSGIEVS